ncbi:DNA repair protein rhp54 [Hordeum vulgare]|nr:DNA repair protein rhp54 [Hordeum vulgare]
MDIDGETLFMEELANQTIVGSKPKGKRKRTKAYTLAEDKLLSECWRDIGQDPKISVEQKCSPYGLLFIALIPVIHIKAKINLEMVLHQMMSLILLTLQMLEIKRKLKIKTKLKIKSKP